MQQLLFSPSSPKLSSGLLQWWVCLDRGTMTGQPCVCVLSVSFQLCVCVVGQFPAVCVRVWSTVAAASALWSSWIVSGCGVECFLIQSLCFQ